MRLTDSYWLAGIVDGEGYVDVKRNTLEVKNCDLDLLRKVQQAAGCGRIYTSGIPREGHKQPYRWVVTSKMDVKRILSSIVSKLITKREKARLVIQGIR